MLSAIELGGLSLAVNASGAPERAGAGWLLPSGPVALLHPFGDTDFYRHGWNSWSPTGWTPLSGPTIGIRNDDERLLTADDADNETPHAHSGSAVGALQGPDGTVLLLGALGLGTPRVGADRDTLWGRAEVDDTEWFVGYGQEDAVFTAYREQLAARLGTRTARAGRVWSSWYAYYEDIDERLIACAVDDLRGYPFDVVQVDDGWEPVVGDWIAGPSFPNGMGATARRITNGGFRAGLWLAPLIALPTSEIATTRPDLLVHDTDGSPLVGGYNWRSHFYVLDTTLPEVQGHLTDVFRRVVDWGYEYLKLDFMYAGALTGVRSTDLPRERVYRDAVRRIRATVGDDVYLLGSGVPMIPSVGVFDGVRVGPDVAPFWASDDRPDDIWGVGARNAIHAGMHRAWLRGLYELDADAMYFRSERNLLDPSQRQLLQDLAAVMGHRSTSDPIAWLRPEERQQLRDSLSRQHPVEQLDRFVFRVDGRLVDFGSAISRASSPYPVSAP